MKINLFATGQTTNIYMKELFDVNNKFCRYLLDTALVKYKKMKSL